MKLKLKYESLEEVPEAHRDLYTERNGAYFLTEIEGLKTAEDISRMQTSLDKERADHKKTKESRDALKVWDDMDHDDVMAKLDRIEELEALGDGKVDEEKMTELVDKRVKSKLNQVESPLKRQIGDLESKLEEATAEVGSLKDEKRITTINDQVRKAAIEAKVVDSALDDILLYAERIFDLDDNGKVITKDGVGVTPGLDAALLLEEVKPTRGHWWPSSEGGGAGGNRGGGAGSGENPWSAKGWNITKQGQYEREHGTVKADQMSALAGVTRTATAPAATK